MRIWLACFVVLFALAELFQWLKQLTLPLPIYILGGAFLAIASNYNKLIGSSLSDSAPESPPVMPSANSPRLSQSTPVAQPTQPIAFTIRQANQPHEKQ